MRFMATSATGHKIKTFSGYGYYEVAEKMVVGVVQGQEGPGWEEG